MHFPFLLLLVLLTNETSAKLGVFLPESVQNWLYYHHKLPSWLPSSLNPYWKDLTVYGRRKFVDAEEIYNDVFVEDKCEDPIRRLKLPI